MALQLTGIQDVTYNAFVRAVAMNSIEKAARIIETHPNILKADYEQDGKVHPILHLAVRQGHTDMAGFLCERQTEAGHNLDARNSTGMNALHVAALQGNPDMVRMLAQKGVPVDAKISDRDDVLSTCIKARNQDDVRDPSNFDTCIKALIGAGAAVSAAAYDMADLFEDDKTIGFLKSVEKERAARPLPQASSTLKLSR